MRKFIPTSARASQRRYSGGGSDCAVRLVPACMLGKLKLAELECGER